MISSQLQSSGVHFSCTKASAMAQERSGHELICFVSHDSTLKWGHCRFVLQQSCQVQQNHDKTRPNVSTVNIGKAKYKKNDLACSNQIMLVTCVWAESESPEALPVPFFMQWIHIPTTVTPLEVTQGAQNSCTEDIGCDLGKKRLFKVINISLRMCGKKKCI